MPHGSYSISKVLYPKEEEEMFDLNSFIFGGVVFLLGFLAIMAWIVPDQASVKTMSWIARRRNFSKISLGVGTVMLVIFLVMIVIAVIELLQYVQMAPWVWVAFWVGLGFFLISLIMLLVTRGNKKKTS